MGNIQTVHSVRKVSFEDIVDTVYKNKHAYLLINTLAITDQECLITHTTPAQMEESIINQLISGNKAHPVIMYGKNTNDTSVLVKYEQLTKLGFTNIMVYPGGLFEWCLLQEIYGSEMFPTTSKVNDLYAYRPQKTLHINLLTQY